MIELTRLRHGETFLLNPDFIERVDSHVDTVVKLTTGSEYVVEEPAGEILRRIVAYRASILAAFPPAVEHRADAELCTAAADASSSVIGTLALEGSPS